MILQTIIRAGITSSIDLSVEWSSTYEYLFVEQRERTNRRTFAASTAIRQETEVEMEIYEADSRINAAAYRTAFRAMGRAFFRSGNRSCPHFTINVVFFRLLRCVPFTDSMVARLLPHIAENKYTCTLRFSTAAISGRHCAKVKCHEWSMERAV